MKKSKLKAEIKISKFWRKKYKKKLNELVVALNRTRDDLRWQEKETSYLKLRVDSLEKELSTLRIKNG